MASAVTDFPEPDSPTIATVSCGATRRSRLRTTVEGPASVSKAMLRFWTSSRDSDRSGTQRMQVERGDSLAPHAIGLTEAADTRAVDVEHAKHSAVTDQRHHDLRIGSTVTRDMSGKLMH